MSLITDSLMVRPNGSSAPATARHYGFQLPLLLKLFCNQSCGHQQVDMLSLLLGQSRPGRQLVKVFSASLVRIVRDDTSRLVAAPRQDALQAWTYHWTCCHGETIADWEAMLWTCFRGTDTAARCKHARALALGRLSLGGLFVRFWVAGRSDSWSVLAFGAKWIISGRQLVRCGLKAGLHHKCIFMAQSATCASVRRLSWHTHP